VDFLGQEHQPTKNNNTTVATSSQFIIITETPPSHQKHHHTIYPAHELRNRERFTPAAHHQSTKPAKPKTNMVTYFN
jgi:hypothetical protein